jgi:hypothetical protein
MIETSILLRLALRRMFFATMPTIVDGGAGDGGDAGGGGAPADTGGDDGAGTETQTDIGDGDIGDGDGELEGDEPAGDEAADDTAAAKPRTPEQRAKHAEKALNELKKADPEGARILRSEHFQNRDFRQEFATPAAAREARQTLESLGGPEGIERMRAEVNEYSAELSRMAEGNPQSVEDLARDYPRGLVKMTPQALDKMRGIDKVAYERTVGKHMAMALSNTGFARSIMRASELLSDGKYDRASSLLRECEAWLTDIDKFKEVDPVGQDPKEQLSDVEKRERALQEEKQKIYHSDVGRTTERSMKGIVAKLLGPLAKERKLNDGQVKRVSVNVFNEIAAHFRGNQAYQSTLKAMLASNKSASEIDRWNTSEVNRVAQRIFRQVWQESGFATGRPRARAAAANGGSSGPQMVGKKPDASKIDWTKDRDRMRYISGEATLKKEFGGGVVKWDRNAL